MAVVWEVANQLGQVQTGACRGLLDLARGGANSYWRGVYIDVGNGSVWGEVEVSSARFDETCVAEWDGIRI